MTNALRRNKHTRPKPVRAGLIVLIAAGLVVAGWAYGQLGSNKSVVKASSSVYMVITKNIAFDNPGQSSFTAQITNPVTATRIISIAKNLPEISQDSASHIVNCPADDGVTYTLLSFSPSLVITAKTSGCATVKFTGSDSLYKPNAAFWEAIHAATGQPIDPTLGTKYF